MTKKECVKCCKQKRKRVCPDSTIIHLSTLKLSVKPIVTSSNINNATPYDIYYVPDPQVF